MFFHFSPRKSRLLNSLSEETVMRRFARFAAGCFLAVGFTVGVSVLGTPPTGNVLRARANIAGEPGSGISGKVTFTQAPADSHSPVTTVEIVAKVEGLTPGLHGMHIHEIGECANTIRPDGSTFVFGATGGHFDPGPSGNSAADANHPFHMGDIPNLEVNAAGVGHLRYTTSRITLSPGPLSVFDANNSAVIVHLNTDNGGPGVAGTSGGPRIACGVIEVEN
jgi:Cu-Zn family superoxide dismutase